MAGAADAVNSALASIDVEDPFAAVDVPPVDISGAMSSVPDFSPGDAEAGRAPALPHMLQRLAALRPRARILAPLPAHARLSAQPLSPPPYARPPIVATHVLRLPRHAYMLWNRSNKD